MAKKELERFVSRLIELMPQMVRGFARQEHNYLTSGRITIPQFWALEYLSRQGKIPMGRLAFFLEVSKPAATGLVDRLISQGLVLREDDPKDHRVVWIKVTLKGHGIIKSIFRQKYQTLTKVYRHITERDRKEHLRILEEILKVLNTSLKTSKKGRRGE